MKEMELFYELVRVALGTQQCLSKTPTEEEWRMLFDMAEKQAVDGITYTALAILATQEQRAPEDIMLDWFSYAEQIKEQNRIVNRRCKDIAKLFTKAGFRSCILKGQGNAQMYPNPLARVSGDIDIWVDASRDELISFLKKKYAVGSIFIHHIDVDIFDDGVPRGQVSDIGKNQRDKNFDTSEVRC